MKKGFGRPWRRFGKQFAVRKFAVRSEEVMKVIINEQPTPMEFVDVWSVAAERGSMNHRRDVCDDNHGKPIEETGLPPAHPNCRCEVVTVLKEK